MLIMLVFDDGLLSGVFEPWTDAGAVIILNGTL